MRTVVEAIEVHPVLPSGQPDGCWLAGNGVSGWTMGGGQRMNWVKDPNSHFSKLDMGGCVGSPRMEARRCEADFLMKFQVGRRRESREGKNVFSGICPEACRDG